MPLVIELKSGDAGALVALIKGRSLGPDVLLQSFSVPTAECFAEAGLHSMALFGADVSVPPTQLVKAGVTYVGASDTMSESSVRALDAVGLTVIAYTVNTPHAFRTALAKGFAGVFTDDPWLLAERLPTATSATRS